MGNNGQQRIPEPALSGCRSGHRPGPRSSTSRPYPSARVGTATIRTEGRTVRSSTSSPPYAADYCTGATVDFTEHRLGAERLAVDPTGPSEGVGARTCRTRRACSSSSSRTSSMPRPWGPADPGPALPEWPGPSARRAGTRGVERALDHMVAEYADLPALPVELYLRTLRHLLSVLVLRLGAVRDEQSAGRTGNAAFVRFHDAVERDFAVTRRVDEYAAALGYSPRTLTRATMAATGVTAKKYIDDRVLLEAKRLLAHGADSAAGVARTLGFADPERLHPSSSACAPGRPRPPSAPRRARTRRGTSGLSSRGAKRRGQGEA